MQKHKRASDSTFSSDDHRDHMSNERTFLSWIRTSIAIMAFGFVVEKFSFFVKQVTTILGKSYTPTAHPLVQGYSSIFGVILIGLGSIICLMAFLRYKKIESDINSNTFQPSMMLDLMLMLTLFTVGIFLMIYLINS